MKEFLDELMNAASGPPVALPPVQIIVRLAVACLVGFGLSFIYKRTFTGVTLSKSILHSHVLLAIGGAMIWLVVGNNLVRAFGLAGTIGLIHYRTRISDPKDTTILLFSMVLGMACGLGQYWVAVIGFVFVAAALYGLSFSHGRHRRDWPVGSDEIRDLMELDDDDRG
ncbi:MAG: DUF4956 domain-containing protein [Phycisphaerales bacterium]|nr:DUF4956 domain-containing protein [Phycisphaerales bacterium]